VVMKVWTLLAQESPWLMDGRVIQVTLAFELFGQDC